MNEILIKQIMEDYSCSYDDVVDDKNHFTIFKINPGRRRYEHIDECFLRLIIINSKLIFSGKKEIIDILKDKYQDKEGQWFLEPENIVELDSLLGKYNYHISMIHPFYISKEKSKIDSKYDIVIYNQEEIKQFEEDERFDEAFTFNIDTPDILGCSISKNGKIIGMAGASIDSPYMVQIGINVKKEYENQGIGSLLVASIKNEIIDKGYLPYYGTSISHIASQKVALNAGFEMAFIELFTMPNNI